MKNPEWHQKGRHKRATEVPVDKPYTREELIVHKDPVKSLAKAVVRQWQEDGCPEQDRDGIAPWIGILKAGK